MTAAKALAMLANFGDWIKKPITHVKIFDDVDKTRVNAIIEKAKTRTPPAILEPEGYEILSAYKFPVLPFALVKNESEAVRKANELGYPCVLKIVSPDILHKTDVGGVMIDIETEAELKAKLNELLTNVKN
ncbi:MAG: acetate--CoA ligase family protein, partial [Candidatus Bathyarchaeia archaeon]